MSRHHANRSLARRKCDFPSCKGGGWVYLEITEPRDGGVLCGRYSRPQDYCPKCQGTGRLNRERRANPPHDIETASLFVAGMPCVWSRPGEKGHHTVGWLWPSQSERRVVHVAAQIIRREAGSE